MERFFLKVFFELLFGFGGGEGGFVGLCFGS